MKILQFTFLFILLLLFVPSFASAQSAADKSWKPFWTQFSVAVKSKNKAAVKRLMSSEKDFFSGGGGETRDEWLKELDQGFWGGIQKSVAKGVKNYSEGGRAGRITKDRYLIFQYIGGKWRFVGVMGD
jgi:hypothetical protein